MINIEIRKNEENQRLDRFLRKYFINAPLSAIYKMIRNNIKVNQKRCKENYILQSGDNIKVYLDDALIETYTKRKERVLAKRQFSIAYEDSNILIVEKPFGLLTHGDATEKKNHLANQVIDYLIQTGAYNPRTEKTFVPAPANRLDRNTTGLVLFGKNAEALRELNASIRNRNAINKVYMTIVKGNLEKPLHLRHKMLKDRVQNKVSVLSENDEGLLMETKVYPIKTNKAYTLVKVSILTGRTHQIRAQLAKMKHPIIGDRKYGNPYINSKMSKQYGLNTQLLHSHELEFCSCEGILEYMNGKKIESSLPDRFSMIERNLFK